MTGAPDDAMLFETGDLARRTRHRHGRYRRRVRHHPRRAAAFRRRLGTTPLGYLGQVRMDRAHHDLIAAIHGAGQTVISISSARGFTHPGRFAIAYEAAYGTRPHATLRR